MSRLTPFTAIAATLVLTAACSSQRADSSGEIRLALTGTSYTGATYRLRGAQLAIDPDGIVLSTEDDPDRRVISLELEAGLHTLSLAAGWRLERISNGVAEPVFAVLSSENPLAFDVIAGEVVPVTLRFRADGEDIVTGPGGVDIGIDVDDVPRGSVDAGVPDAPAPPDAQPAAQLQYVVNRIELPTSSSTSIRLDIDGNGSNENKLGAILTVLDQQSSGAFELQTGVDRGVARGDTILLASIEASSLFEGPARVSTFEGSSVWPEPCAGADDTVCGQHLRGDGTFAISPLVAAGAVEGAFAAGSFRGGPGQITLRLPLGGAPIEVPLSSARVVLTGVDDNGIASGLLGGGIARADVDGIVVPHIARLIADIVARDCSGGDPLDSCGCESGSSGGTLRNLFDAAPEDCVIAVDEVRDSPFIRTLLGPDLDLVPPFGQTDSLSFVVGISAVRASFSQ